MDATQVAHEHAVDIDPHVVVTGEVVGDRLATIGALSSRVAAVPLDEAGGHAEAEVVVDLGADRRDAILGKLAALLVEHVFTGVEREELPVRRLAACIDSPGIVEREGFGLRIERGEVLLAVYSTRG